MAIKKESEITQIVLNPGGSMFVTLQHTFIERGEKVGNGSERVEYTLDDEPTEPYLQELLAVQIKYAPEEEAE